jgi:5,10-methylenetetrahydromethanopterin reductase
MTATPGWGVWIEPLLPVPQLVELVRLAEDSGAGYAFIADEGTDRDVYVALAAIAIGTRRIRLVTGITNPFSRHPVASAAAFASLEELAPGRIIAGFGVGGSRVLGPMALAPGKPFTALRETVDVVDRLLAREEVTFHGEIHLDAARIPWSPRRLPIATAGRGPRVEAFGSEVADWNLVAGKPLVEVPGLLERLRAANPEHPARIAWSTYVAWSPEMIEEIRPHFTYATVDMPPETRALLGIDSATTERIRAVMLRDGVHAAAHLVPDGVIHATAVVGDKQQVVDQLAAIRCSAAPDLFVLPMNGYSTAAALITEAAPLIHAAGFAPASLDEQDEPLSRPHLTFPTADAVSSTR